MLAGARLQAPSCAAPSLLPQVRRGAALVNADVRRENGLLLIQRLRDTRDGFISLGKQASQQGRGRTSSRYGRRAELLDDAIAWIEGSIKEHEDQVEACAVSDGLNAAYADVLNVLPDHLGQNFPLAKEHLMSVTSELERLFAWASFWTEQAETLEFKSACRIVVECVGPLLRPSSEKARAAK